jgi:exopolysaccharide biosynthesis predicted pyruvyltransferase EpsI
MHTCDHSRLLLRETLRELLPAGTRCGIVLYPDHWNAGDAAIWCGTRQLLRELGVEVAYGCDTTSYDKRALSHALPEGPILIAGGGNFGDVYVPEHALRLQVLEDHPGRPVIQLPQSIWFRGTEGLAATADALRKHANATLLLRDAPSLAFAQRHFSSLARLCPDAAIALDLSTVPRQPDVPMVAVWRDDRESADPPPPMPAGSLACDWLLPGGVLPPEQARQMSIAGLEFYHWVGRPKLGEPCPVRRRMAWRHQPWLWDQLALDRCLRGCRMLSRGRVTITNRLHAHLMCLLMGQPHVACDVTNGKVFAYRDTWGCDAPFVRFAGSPAEAVDLAAELLATCGHTDGGNRNAGS